MATNAVLDKGVILGYCFFSDPHHERCADYIDVERVDYFTTREIEDVYRRKKNDIVRRHRRAILDHVKHVTTEYDGTLDRADIEEIQAGIDRRTNDAWRYLLDFYEGSAGRAVVELTRRLRNVARDIEQRAEARKETLYPQLMGWLRFDSHQDVQSDLEPLRRRDEEDFWICIDAHDIAASIEGETELATTNPSDFGVEEIEALILDVTAIDSIEYVFVPISYEPDG